MKYFKQKVIFHRSTRVLGPKLMGDHLPFRAITPERLRVRNKIVMYHNYFRSQVEPKASNMLKMVGFLLLFNLIACSYKNTNSLPQLITNQDVFQEMA